MDLTQELLENAGTVSQGSSYLKEGLWSWKVNGDNYSIKQRLGRVGLIEHTADQLGAEYCSSVAHALKGTGTVAVSY